MRAFLDYTPSTYTPTRGLYRTFRWGRHLQLFFLDARSFRSAKATAACGGDIAPTAPQAVRQAFAALSPGLAKPVPQACLDAIASPERTLLGRDQLERFRAAIRASTATFKVVVNPVPLMQLYALPYDRWEGYAADRARMLAALAGVRNVVVLTTDTHAHLIGEIRSQTFAPGGPVGTGIWEVVTGPVATNTLCERDRRLPRLAGLRGCRNGCVLQAAAAQRPRAPLRPDGHVRLRAGHGHGHDAPGRAEERGRQACARCHGRAVRGARRPRGVTDA